MSNSLAEPFAGVEDVWVGPLDKGDVMGQVLGELRGA
jgi:hypothetical protein